MPDEQQVLLLLGGIDGDVRPGAQGAADGGFIGSGLQRDQHGADLRRGERGNAAGQAGRTFQQQRLEPGRGRWLSTRARRAARSRRMASPGWSNWIAIASLTVKKASPSPPVPTMPRVRPDDFIDILAQA